MLQARGDDAQDDGGFSSMDNVGRDEGGRFVPAGAIRAVAHPLVAGHVLFVVVGILEKLGGDVEGLAIGPRFAGQGNGDGRAFVGLEPEGFGKVQPSDLFSEFVVDGEFGDG